jgi:hypothetical protein
VVEAGPSFIPFGVALVPVEVLYRLISSAIEEARSDKESVLEYLSVGHDVDGNWFSNMVDDIVEF